MIIEAIASSKVTGKAVPMSEATEVRDDSETPEVAREHGTEPRPVLAEERLADAVVVVEGDELGVAQQAGAYTELRRSPRCPAAGGAPRR